MISIEKLAGDQFVNEPGTRVKILVNNTLFNSRELIRSDNYSSFVREINRRLSNYNKLSSPTGTDQTNIFAISSFIECKAILKRIANISKTVMPFIVQKINDGDNVIINRVNNTLPLFVELDKKIELIHRLMACKKMNILHVVQFVNAVTNLYVQMNVLLAVKMVNTSSSKNINVYSLYTEICHIHKYCHTFTKNYNLHTKKTVKDKIILQKLLLNDQVRPLSKNTNALKNLKEYIFDLEYKGIEPRIRQSYLLEELQDYVKSVLVVMYSISDGSWGVDKNTKTTLFKCLADSSILNTTIATINKLLNTLK